MEIINCCPVLIANIIIVATVQVMFYIMTNKIISLNHFCYSQWSGYLVIYLQNRNKFLQLPNISVIY